MLYFLAMIQTKKLFILILMLPLVMTGILFTCICPSAQAAAAIIPTLHQNHHCCCPDFLMPEDPIAINKAVVSNSVFNERSFDLVSNTVSFQSDVHTLRFSDTSDPPEYSSQDPDLKNEILRI